MVNVVGPGCAWQEQALRAGRIFHGCGRFAQGSIPWKLFRLDRQPPQFERYRVDCQGAIIACLAPLIASLDQVSAGLDRDAKTEFEVLAVLVEKPKMDERATGYQAEVGFQPSGADVPGSYDLFYVARETAGAGPGID